MNRINTLFGIEYPIVQGGMVWCSGWRLASAVSNAGLDWACWEQAPCIPKHCGNISANAGRRPTNRSGINVPLMYPQLDEVMQLIVDEGVKIVFTSAGNPKLWTGFLKSHGITVVHVVSSSKFARKCEEAGVDAIVAEGFEAGGHNGREETTTLCLIPAVRRVTSLPLIAAGGIATGARDAGSHDPRGRRRADRNPLRIRRRKLGTRKLQKPLPESGRGRYDADAQKSFSHALGQGRFLPRGRRGREPRSYGRRAENAFSEKDAPKKVCSKATSITESLK